MVTRKDAPIDKELAALLRKAREDSGYTRDQIAERSGYGTRHIAAIENGEKNPSAKCLCRLIRAIGVSADTIVYPENRKYETDSDHLLRLINTCNERDRKAIKAMVEALLFSRESNNEPNL